MSAPAPDTTRAIVFGLPLLLLAAGDPSNAQLLHCVATSGADHAAWVVDWQSAVRVSASEGAAEWRLEAGKDVMGNVQIDFRDETHLPQVFIGGELKEDWTRGRTVRVSCATPPKGNDP